jgi:PAS domain S-box-containing protein
MKGNKPKGKPAGLISSRDSTRQKKTEEALRQSGERYRTILQEIQDSYFEANLAGNFTFFNETTHRDLGYSREELMGMNYRAYIAPEDAETMYKAFNQVYRTGKTIRTTTFKVVTKDGVIKFAESWVSPLRNERGEIVGFRGLSREITEQKRVEEALRQSEERYRTILDEMQDDYFEVDLAGNYTFVNEANARQLGYPKEELIGMNYRVYIHPDDVENVYKTFNQVYRKGQPIRACTYKIVRKDGSTGLGELSVFPLRNDKGEIIGFRGIGRDVTERMQMIEALRQSEERYRTVLEQMEEAYYELDIAGNLTLFNDALCRQLGYSREELMGMDYRVYTPPEDVKKVFETYNRVYRTGEPVKSFPVERIRKDGTRIFAEFSAFPLRNERGEIIGFRGIVHDITERKQAELERKQMEQKAQLASRLASVGELASGVAHEINNPLTGVIGYAHLLLDRKDIPQDIRHDLEIINEGAQRVAAIIRKLLTFARQQKPEQKFANINEIIGTTLDLRAYELASNNIRVAFQPARDLPMTIVDPGQLQQVFLNLIINAETAMKLAHGRGKLSIKTEHIDNTMRISFKDNGPGIAKGNLERIFDPFFTTREIVQGTGLGLNVCHGIITEHKGKIWVESKLGRGATFIVELPIVTEDSQLVLLEPTVEEPKKVTKAKILVIDDELVIRQFVSRVLSEEGHEVEVVDKAEDALEKIKSKRCHLILLDIKMPGISGIELYKQFQEIAPSLMKRVVFITGDVMGKRTTDFLAKTKAPCMIKPFDAEQLKTEINRILARG